MCAVILAQQGSKSLMMAAASMWEWTRRHPWRAAAWLLVVVLALASLRVCGAQPRLDRNWVDNLAVMPKVQTTDAGFALDGVVDWSYTKDGPATQTVGDFAAPAVRRAMPP